MMIFRRYIPALCMVVLFLFSPPLLRSFGMENVKDKIPPTFTWLSPERYSVLTTNSVRVSVDAYDNPDGSGIEKVQYYAQYSSHIGHNSELQLIGEDTTSPYEIIWNCANIPDQNIGKLALLCKVFDNAGNVSIKALGQSNEIWSEFVLDREPEFNALHISSRWTKKKVVVDGVILEWDAPDSLVFKNNDNTITVYSMFDRTNLYLYIRVKDNSIIDHFNSPEDKIVSTIPMEDAIEIYFDTKIDRFEICLPDDRHFLISPRGHKYRSIYYDKALSRKEADVNVAITVNGTINNDHDIDTGYSMEIAIPWDHLGVSPGKIVKMGFEVCNCDQDFETGSYFFSGWTTTQSGLKNPSEWGTIVLVGKQKSFTAVIVAGIVGSILIGTLLLLNIKRRNSIIPLHEEIPIQEEFPQVIEDEYITKAKAYIGEHYHDETFSRDQVANYIGMSSPYFGKYFKKELHCTFSDYVTSLRIEKARQLLLYTRKNIAEISFEVGFENPSYFCSLFKNIEHMSPKEFRKQYKHEI